jgi:uncharacterized protein
MLTPEDGKQLIILARKSIGSYFSGQEIDLEQYSKFNKKQGVFVTLHKHGELRGCIGFPHPTFQLYKAVSDAARAAAFKDTRFPKLEESELKDLDIELSVLTVPEEIDAEPAHYTKQIKIGEDGLIIKGPFGSGLLLPQVFTEYKCTPEQALEMTCQKAGLPTDAWKDKRNKVLKFQAQIFSEND